MMCMDLDYTAYPNQDWVSNWSLTLLILILFHQQLKHPRFTRTN